VLRLSKQKIKMRANNFLFSFRQAIYKHKESSRKAKEVRANFFDNRKQA
jgi:hypothetical protein